MNRKRMKEEWKRIPQYPRYEISSKGRVKSFTSGEHPEGKILTNKLDKYGYLTITLQDGETRSPNNKSCEKKIHRLVAEAFIPIPEELKEYDKKKLQVDHIIPIADGGGLFDKDGDYNLRWVTPKGNANNPNTLRKYRQNAKAQRKQVYQYTEDLQLVSAYTSTLDAARKLEKSQGTITSCCNGVLKRYLGFIFSYKKLGNREQREKLENSRKTTKRREKIHKSILKACRKFYTKHKKTKNEWNKQYYKTHREERLKYQQEYYIKKKQKKNSGNHSKTLNTDT